MSKQDDPSECDICGFGHFFGRCSQCGYETPPKAPPADIRQEGQPCQDPVVERVVELLRTRSTFGLKKYSMTIDSNPGGLDEFLQHLHEELLDAANYVQKCRDLLNSRHHPDSPR